MLYDSRMDYPVCPNFRERSCQQSEVVLCKETDDAFLFQCRTCKCRFIETKPRYDAKAKYEQAMRAKAQGGVR